MNALFVSHYPSPCTTTLASLVKGEVLSPERIRATTGGIATPLLPKPHYPSKIANTLASLVKGEVLSPERIRATTGGIAFLPHPFRFSDTSVTNPSIVGSASHCNRSSPLHKGAKGDSALPTLPKLHYPSKSTISLPPLSKVRCCRPKEFGRLPEGLPQLHRPSPSPQPLQKDNSTLLRTTFLPYERSASFASLRNSGRSTSGIHARPLSKVRCCRPLDYRTAKTGGAVNGGAFLPFILTVDRLGWVCYLLTAIHSH